MKEKSTRLILAVAVGLNVAMLACQCSGPAVPPTRRVEPQEEPTEELQQREAPETYQEEQPEVEEAEPPEEEPASEHDVLDDLAEELRLGVLRPRLKMHPAPVDLPGVQFEPRDTDCYRLRLWGFPFGEVARLELYDPSGQLVAAHEEARERGRPERGLKETHLFLGGRSAGDWTVVVDSAGVRMRTPLHVAEPVGPKMSIAREGVGPFTTADQCGVSTYTRDDRMVLFGAGFPLARTLPLGIYEWREDRDAQRFYELVHRQEVRTDDDGRFEVHQAVRSLVPDSGRAYVATVALGPSASDGVGPRVGFLVESSIPAPGKAVILELAVAGGPFFDSRVQGAVLAALNQSQLRERFPRVPMMLLFSSGGSAIDASGEPWDPDLARQLLAQAGYQDGVRAQFLYPDGDAELAAIARDMVSDLAHGGISADLVAVPRSDLGAHTGTRAAAGEPVLWLVRR